MKKILSFIVLSALLVGLAAPVLVGAQDQKIKECCTLGQKIDFGDGTVCEGKSVAAPGDTAGKDCTGIWCAKSATSWGMFCLVNVVYNVTNWIFYLMMVAVVIVFVIAGAMFMTAGGDTEKTKSAKGMMILAIIGLVIALIAKLIPSVVKLIVGM